MEGRGRSAWRLAAVAAAAAIGAICLAAPAQAATQVGQTFTPPGPCTGGTTFVQSSAPGGQYTLPSTGVITAWSFQASAGSFPAALKLKILRPAGGTNFTVIADSALEIPIGSSLNRFQTRISAQAGDVLGFLLADPGTPPCGRTMAGYSYGYVPSDVPPGTTASFGNTGGTQFDIAAVLEPDADNDGFGDETQDGCPTNETSQQSPCPVPDTTIIKRPDDKSKKKQATFEFTSSIAGSTFECSLDGGPFAACSSPDTLKVKKGHHSLEVRAVAHGQTDPTPASDEWTVKKKKKRK